jgi:carbamoyltransferase
MQPVNAYRCFMRTKTDYLVMGSYLFDKREQPERVEKSDWRQTYELD